MSLKDIQGLILEGVDKVCGPPEAKPISMDDGIVIYKRLTRSRGRLAGCGKTWHSITTGSWRSTNVRRSTFAPRSA